MPNKSWQLLDWTFKNVDFDYRARKSQSDRTFYVVFLNWCLIWIWRPIVTWRYWTKAFWNRDALKHFIPKKWTGMWRSVTDGREFSADSLFSTVLRVFNKTIASRMHSIESLPEIHKNKKMILYVAHLLPVTMPPIMYTAYVFYWGSKPFVTIRKVRESRTHSPPVRSFSANTSKMAAILCRRWTIRRQT